MQSYFGCFIHFIGHPPPTNQPASPPTITQQARYCLLVRLVPAVQSIAAACRRSSSSNVVLMSSCTPIPRSSGPLP